MSGPSDQEKKEGKAGQEAATETAMIEDLTGTTVTVTVTMDDGVIEGGHTDDEMMTVMEIEGMTEVAVLVQGLLVEQTEHAIKSHNVIIIDDLVLVQENVRQSGTTKTSDGAWTE